MKTLPAQHDLRHLHAALAYVTNWTVAVDGGAHTGGWTAVMAERFATVYAFEPVHHARIEPRSNVRIMPVALGDTPGTAAMLPGTENEGQCHVDPCGEGTVVVPLDALNLPTCGLLKLDVEGYELQALRGARMTVAECRPVIVAEENGLCERYGIHRTAMGDLLRAWGYRMVQRCNKDEIWVPT